MVVREDDDVLKTLLLTDSDRDKLGLSGPTPTGDPAELAEVYLRRSHKREDIATLRSHLRQIAGWMQREGVVIRRVWLEQLSASKVSVSRREYEAAVHAVTVLGLSRTLAVWKTDRLDRRGMGAVGTLLDRLDARRARAVFVTEGLDSSQPGARSILAFLAERAREEARDISTRVDIGHAAHRELGRRGPGYDPYGIVTDPGSGKVRPSDDPEERRTTALIRSELLAGESINVTKNKLNESGCRTRSGALWGGSTLARLVRNPLIAGMVPDPVRVADEHGVPQDSWSTTRSPLLSPTGEIVTCGAGWLTPAEWFKIAESRRSRQFATRGKRSSEYLLTAGGMTCPYCGKGVENAGRSYSCATHRRFGPVGCRGTHVSRESADAYVREAWIDHVSALGPRHPTVLEIAKTHYRLVNPEVEEQLGQFEAAASAAGDKLARLEDDYYVHGRLEEARFTELSGRLRAMRAQAEKSAEALRGSVRADTSVFNEPEDVERFWDARTAAEKRALLRAVLAEPIRLGESPGQGRKIPIQDRLTIKWADE